MLPTDEGVLVDRGDHHLPRLVWAVDRALPLSVRRRVRYLVRHRRLPHLSHPRTFTEKVQWRVLRDRRPLLAWTCDKLAMKEYALGAGVPGLRVPVTYWSGTDLGELAGVDLPERWVLKPNHRFGFVEFGTGRPDVAALQRRTAGWLAERQSTRGEWAYGQARRCLLVEEMISTTPPDDYKVFVFDGKPRAVALHSNRFAGHQNRMYSADWEPIGASRGSDLGEVAPRPDRLEDLLDTAARLGEPFDFIRVDLYDVEGRTWFGELTPYPASGLTVLEPPELDARLGSYWHLPDDVAA